jgi:trimethylamine---corrinoid protein Co-methyltransferase
MRPLAGFLRALNDDELDQLHDSVMALLEEPGMRIENAQILEALRKKGARIDSSAETAHFPRALLEETIAIARAEEQARVAVDPSGVDAPGQLGFSWHTPFACRTPPVMTSIGGGAPMYYDHEKKANRYATGDDFLRTVHFAEGIPEVVTVGNAVHYLREPDGSEVPPKMVAIKGAAAVALHSSKPGCTSIIDVRQLPYLMEMGRIVKGSAEAYLRNPIFVNIHDTESPLRVTRPEASIILEMARQKLPIFILPMPMAGITTPVFPIASAIVGAAEILGVWAAAKAVRDDCPVQARCVSGVLNAATGAACFSTPEATLIDLAVAQLFRERYGSRCGTGVGLIDAPAPGPLSIFERTFKATATNLAGEPVFPVGIIGGAVVFSIEQVIIDLDIAAYARQLCQGIGGTQLAQSLALIREKGIGGLYLDTEHTALNFRESLVMPSVMTRLKSTDVSNARAHDPVDAAHARCSDILSRTPMFTVDDARRRAIDAVVGRAARELSSIQGALV